MKPFIRLTIDFFFDEDGERYPYKIERERSTPNYYMLTIYEKYGDPSRLPDTLAFAVFDSGLFDMSMPSSWIGTAAYIARKLGLVAGPVSTDEYRYGAGVLISSHVKLHVMQTSQLFLFPD